MRRRNIYEQKVLSVIIYEQFHLLNFQVGFLFSV